jgi:hypothetical protein
MNVISVFAEISILFTKLITLLSKSVKTNPYWPPGVIVNYIFVFAGICFLKWFECEPNTIY